MSKKREPFSLEANLTKIKQILEAMRENQTNFDRNVELFQEGSDLIRKSRKYLDNSELLFKRLIDDEGDIREVEEG